MRRAFVKADFRGKNKNRETFVAITENKNQPGRWPAQPEKPFHKRTTIQDMKRVILDERKGYTTTAPHPDSLVHVLNYGAITVSKAPAALKKTLPSNAAPITAPTMPTLATQELACFLPLVSALLDILIEDQCPESASQPNISQPINVLYTLINSMQTQDLLQVLQSSATRITGVICVYTPNPKHDGYKTIIIDSGTVGTTTPSLPFLDIPESKSIRLVVSPSVLTTTSKTAAPSSVATSSTLKQGSGDNAPLSTAGSVKRKHINTSAKQEEVILWLQDELKVQDNFDYEKDLLPLLSHLPLQNPDAAKLWTWIGKFVRKYNDRKCPVNKKSVMKVAIAQALSRRQTWLVGIEEGYHYISYYGAGGKSPNAEII
ncbi:hypothetical protein D9758_004557 [Tetrapyrgos nigripes]|uniref:Uncharacterized protein n=1 Tax=Tetrapyrgos nigripes TaxID=182062 RepID=A0A8H5H0D3_9AGAR|nr:hypothetical protein D9758_004557 [Tetrapyrgos nigripes]